MLVDVVLLRANGRPLPKVVTQAAMAKRPVRGMLQVDYCRHLQRWEDRVSPKIAQLIVPGTADLAMRGLLFADVGVMRNWQFVVTGREDRGDQREPLRLGPAQTWWCRVVVEPVGDAAGAFPTAPRDVARCAPACSG